MFALRSMNGDTFRHARRMAGDDDDVQRAINQLIVDLKEAKLWDRLDVVCVVADTEANSLLDIKGMQDAVVDSSSGPGPTWTSTGGFAVKDVLATPANKWIDSQFNASLSSNWVDGDNSMWCYLKSATFPGNNDRFMGATHGTGSGGIAQLMNDTSGDLANEMETNFPAGIQSMSAAGFFGASRLGASTVNTHDDSGTTQTSTQSATSVLPNDAAYTVLVGGTNYFGSKSGQVDGELTAWGFGDGFNHADWTALRTAITTYLTARGAA